MPDLIIELYRALFAKCYKMIAQRDAWRDASLAQAQEIQALRAELEITRDHRDFLRRRGDEWRQAAIDATRLVRANQDAFVVARGRKVDSARPYGAPKR